MSKFVDMRKKFLKRLKKYLESDKETVLKIEKKIIKSVEEECQNLGQLIYIENERSDGFKKIYESYMRQLLINLDPKSSVNNEELKKKMQNIDTEYDEIVKNIRECPQKLFPEKNKSYFDIIEKQERIAYNKDYDIQSSHVCYKCKSNKCVATLAQIRSADEAMSVLITCLNCGNRW